MQVILVQQGGKWVDRRGASVNYVTGVNEAQLLYNCGSEDEVINLFVGAGLSGPPSEPRRLAGGRKPLRAVTER